MNAPFDASQLGPNALKMYSPSSGGSAPIGTVKTVTATHDWKQPSSVCDCVAR